MRIQPTPVMTSTPHVEGADIRPSRRERPPSRPRSDVIELSPSNRTALWFSIVALELLNAIWLAGIATIYGGYRRRDSFLWIVRVYYLFSEAYTFLEKASTVITVTYATFSIIYGVMAFRRIWVSLLHRELRFGGPTLSRLRSSYFSGSFGTQQMRVASSTVKDLGRVVPVHVPASVASRVRSWTKRITRFRSAVGVHGAFFDLRVMFDESIELISQTISAFSASRSISNLYLNQSYGIVIFLSGISGVAIHRMYHSNLAKQRTARLLSDLALDFVWGSILPLWMYYPLLRAYYSQAGLEASIEESQSSAREVERILVLSWGSFALSIIPFLNSLLVILELQDILFEVQAASTCQVSTITSGVSSQSHKERRRSSRTVIRLRAAHKNSSHTTTSGSLQSWNIACISRVFHIVLAVYGTLFFAVSIAASGIFHRHSEHVQFLNCDSRVYPWFTIKDACLTRSINCSSEGIVGSELELTAILDVFDEQSLADLKLIECPALEMPRAIHRFSRIQSLIIEKSTLIKWEASVGLQSEFFPELRTIKLMFVELAVEPLGLTAVPVTTSIEWMRIVNTNATNLLATVGTSWAFVVYFDCDYCALHSVPLVVNTMHRLLTLSLVGNDITEVSDTWVNRWNIKLVGLWLNENPRLSVLPDVIWRQAMTCNIFFLQQTNISVIPEWLPSVVGPTFQIYGFGSPICSPSASMAPEYGVVNCEFQSN